MTQVKSKFSEAQREGRNAFFRGDGLQDNPYDRGLQQVDYANWRDGFFSAQSSGHDWSFDKRVG